MVLRISRRGQGAAGDVFSTLDQIIDSLVQVGEFFALRSSVF
jgi:hypothetical protein